MPRFIADPLQKQDTVVQPDISVKNLNKVYEGGFQALKNINLEIKRGEIFALLGPNGAGKTTMISIICGLANMSSGEVKAGGHDIVKDYRKARELIGLVPQELNTDAFETVWKAAYDFYFESIYVFGHLSQLYTGTKPPC